MSALSKYRAALTFVGGVLVGLATGVAVILLGGYDLVRQQELNEQWREIAELRRENQELLDDLLESLSWQKFQLPTRRYRCSSGLQGYSF